VDPFVSSAPLLGDPTALRTRLAEDGYLYFPALLGALELDHLRSEILRAVEPLGWLASGSDPVDGVPDEHPRLDHRPGYNEGCAAIQACESFHRLAHDPRLTTLAASVLDAPVLVHPRKVARVMWPWPSEIATAPHQDWQFFQGSTDLLTCWIPLHDCPTAFGGLRVLRGSQHDGVHEMLPSKGTSPIRVVVDDHDRRWASTHYRCGDVLLFHCLTVHSAQPNVTDRLRVSVDYRYQPLDDPISEDSLKPQYHPEVPDWPELTRGWSTTAWVDQPAGCSPFTRTDPTSIETYHLELSPPRSRVLDAAEAP
jgi:hypothetical protein